MKIWKYPLEVVDEQFIQMPFGARILTVQMQGEKPCLWALVNPEIVTLPRIIRTIGTGNPIDGALGAYIGTYQMHGGALVFHVFDEDAS